MANSSNKQYLGAYKGTPIRCRHSEMVSITDLWKANGEPSSLRPDKWLKQSSVQEIMRSLANKFGCEVIVNKFGVVVEASKIFEIIRGGDRRFQGTFVCRKLGDLYTQALSEDCNDWFVDAWNLDNSTEFDNDFDNDEDIFDSTEPVKAKKKEIPLGSRNLEVYQMPNGEYKLSQTQCAKAVHNDDSRSERSFREFLVSNSPEALPYKNFRPAKLEVVGNNASINAIPIPLAAAYWTKESISGNHDASRLLGACTVESIERRADKAFEVAKTEEQYNQRFEEVFKGIIANVPELSSLSTKEKDAVGVSAPLSGFYGKIQKSLRKSYSRSAVSKKTKEDLRRDLSYLASHSSSHSWRLTPQQEINYQIGELKKVKYPDLVSGIISFNSEVKDSTTVFIFQLYDFLVSDDDVAECVLKRRYIQLTKQSFNVDYAYLFLVAPFGANFAATKFVHECLPDDSRGFVGIVTLKEMVEFYQKQVIASRTQSVIKGQIKKKFSELTDYHIPCSPLDVFEDSIQLSLDLGEAS